MRKAKHGLHENFYKALGNRRTQSLRRRPGIGSRSSEAPFTGLWSQKGRVGCDALMHDAM